MKKTAKTKKTEFVPYGLGYKVKILSQLLGRSLQHQLDPYGLTPPHWLVLNCLWKEDGLPINQLIEKLLQVGGTMTGVIDRMEERGLATRKRDEVDRRMWRIYLTDKGRQLQSEIPPLIARMRQKTIKGIDTDDMQIFMRVLDEIIDNAIAQNEELKGQ